MEKKIESYLREQVKKHGGIAFKFVSPGYSGVPDRLVIMPSGKILFVEVKDTGKKLRPLQQSIINTLRALNARCEVVDSKEQINELVYDLLTP